MTLRQAQDGAARLLIVGPQGSGKGTQGVRIAEAFGIPAISTGDVFRGAVAAGTPLGEQVKAIIEAGDLVPDELTSAVVRERLSQPDAAEGFLLDGYPRNVAQVMHLDEFLEGRGEAIDAVIARLSRRAAEQGRSDDTEEGIANRLAIYERETAPILEIYGARGVVERIDGVGSLDQITARIVSALEARGLGRGAAA